MFVPQQREGYKMVNGRTLVCPSYGHGHAWPCRGPLPSICFSCLLNLAELNTVAVSHSSPAQGGEIADASY